MCTTASPPPTVSLEPPSDSDDRRAAPVACRPNVPVAGASAAFFRKTLAIADLELRKLRRDPTELITRGSSQFFGCC